MSNGLDPDQDQTAYKGYQQIVKVATSWQRNNNLPVCIAQAVLSWTDNQASMDCKGGSWVMHQSFAIMGANKLYLGDVPAVPCRLPIKQWYSLARLKYHVLSRSRGYARLLISTKRMVFLSQA